MPTRIISVDLQPNTIASGGQTTARVEYESAEDDTINVEASTGYTVEPNMLPAPYAPNGGSTSGELTISGPPGKCRLKFKLPGSSSQSILDVT